jgi:hypothetical protein
MGNPKATPLDRPRHTIVRTKYHAAEVSELRVILSRLNGFTAPSSVLASGKVNSDNKADISKFSQLPIDN